MKVKKIDHICIAVKNLEEAKKVWEPILGKSPDDPYVDEYSGIRVARYWLGEVGFELMEPLGPNSDVARHIEKRGEGVMIIGFNVENTRAAIAELAPKGYPFIPNATPLADDPSKAARPFRDCEYAFIHPKKVNGVLLELIDDKWTVFEQKNAPKGDKKPKK
jgi:methylmalonyl-CoA/ethylmalonyl-CoA epimerase